MTKDTSPDLRLLFNPSSVALIGASPDETKSGGRFLNRLTTQGFRGQVYPVNLREGEIMGLRAYSTVLDIPDGVDLAIMTIPAPSVPQAMAECAQKGIRFVIVHSSGFREVGAGDLEAEVVGAARRGGTRMVGPNCMGVYSAEARLCVMEADFFEPDGADVAFIAQSGTICDNFIHLGHERGLRFSQAVSSGNEADLTALDYLRYFADDPKVGVIASYMEGVREGRKFMELAGEVSRRKPIIVWKAGKTAAGARAIQSHTGSLAVADRVCDAAFLQAGIIVAHDLEELCDFAVAFASPYLPQGRRMGILVDTGGGGVAAADACESVGLEVPVYPQDIQAKLREFLAGVIPPFSGISNPVDLVSPRYVDYVRLFQGCVEIMAGTV
ncbi:MAG: CoA-binding protein, partial [Dehalococcoidia bacterium]